MSLRVWLPLTKDLRQQGLSNVTVTNNGATFNSAGKLGGCYQFNASGYLKETSINWTNFNTSEFSLCCWYKEPSPVASGNSQMICIGTSSGWNNIRIGLLRRTSNGYPMFSVSDGSNNVNYNFTANSFSLDTWNHIVCTYNNGTMKMYLNGELHKTYTTTIVPVLNSSQHLGIGAASNGAEPLTGYLNDVRIYDHCLSPMEVKELAKGLILHYPLNRQGWGQENLDNFSSVVSNWTMESLSGSNYSDSSYGNVIKLVTNAANQRMYHNVISTLWQSGQVYTVSFLAKADQNGRTCDMSRSIADFSPTFTLTTQWKRYSGKITSTATPGGGTLSFRINQSGATVYITQIKLEKGTIATPYCPSSSEALYTTMGLNSTTEYDCSGYCNNGNKMTNTITYTSDTAKYAVSTHFNGTYDGILIENLQLSDIINSAVTYAFWIKPESESGARSVYFGSYSTGPSWSIEKTTGNVMRSYWNGSPDETCSGATITDGVWQHVCLTKNGTSDIKVYINGVQKWASTATHSNLNFPTTFRIGRDTRSNDGTPYKGLMSDFRIYATALSADDVKSLYQNSAYIDSSGNVYGAVHSEV